MEEPGYLLMLANYQVKALGLAASWHSKSHISQPGWPHLNRKHANWSDMKSFYHNFSFGFIELGSGTACFLLVPGTKGHYQFVTVVTSLPPLFLFLPSFSPFPSSPFHFSPLFSSSLLLSSVFSSHFLSFKTGSFPVSQAALKLMIFLPQELIAGRGGIPLFPSYPWVSILCSNLWIEIIKWLLITQGLFLLQHLFPPKLFGHHHSGAQYTEGHQPEWRITSVSGRNDTDLLLY